MKILFDENIPFGQRVLNPFGVLSPVPGRNIPETELADAEVLVIRSVTQVDRALIRRAPKLRFVGSCTIGTDHIARQALSEAGIGFAHAPGCNANSVAEYVLSVLLNHRPALDRLVAGETLGIVGMGNVGRAVVRTMAMLGIRCRYYDPLLSPAQAVSIDADRVHTLDDVLGLPVVSCHAPLTREGPHPSFHMLTIELLRRLPQSALLINAGRGDVMANADLHRLLDERPDIQLALDVWPDEPALDKALLARCSIATPHIAGYSQEGKVQGLLQVTQQLSQALQMPISTPSSSDLLGPPEPIELTDDGLEQQLSALLSAYDVMQDDRRMRDAMAAAEGADIARAFDHLRKNYPARREIRGRKIHGCEAALPIAALCSDDSV